MIVATILSVILIILLCGGCGTMAPIVPKDPRIPVDPQTNAYIVNPVYTGVGQVAQVTPVPYLPQAVAAGTSLLAIAAIFMNRRLANKLKKAKEEKQ